MSISARLLILLLATTVASSLSAGEKLTMKFHEGESYDYYFEQDIEAVSKVNGQEATSKINQKLYLNTHIISIDDSGNAKAEQTIDRVRFKMSLSQPVEKTVDADTASKESTTDPETARVLASLSKLVGEAIGMTLAPNGEIIDVVIPQKILDAQQGSGVVQSGAGDQLEQTFKQSGIRLPDKEISKGDTWEQTMELKQPFGTMVVTTTYTYQGKDEKGLHRIDASMDFHLEPAENLPFKVTVTPKEATGSFLFDNEAGKLTKSAVNQTLEVGLGDYGTQTVTTRVLMTLGDGPEENPNASDDAPPAKKPTSEKE